MNTIQSTSFPCRRSRDAFISKYVYTLVKKKWKHDYLVSFISIYMYNINKSDVINSKIVSNKQYYVWIHHINKELQITNMYYTLKLVILHFNQNICLGKMTPPPPKKKTHNK